MTYPKILSLEIKETYLQAPFLIEDKLLLLQEKLVSLMEGKAKLFIMGFLETGKIPFLISVRINMLPSL
jgi:hypothetical protein